MTVTSFLRKLNGRRPMVNSDGTPLPEITTLINSIVDRFNANFTALDGQATSIEATDVLTGAASSGFSAERVVTDTLTISWDIGTAAQAKASVIDGSVTYAKIQDVSATDKVLGRSTAGAGVVEEIACTAAGRALLDDADASAQRDTLSLGTVVSTAAGISVTDPSGDEPKVQFLDGSGQVGYMRMQRVGASQWVCEIDSQQFQIIGSDSASTSRTMASLNPDTGVILDDAKGSGAVSLRSGGTTRISVNSTGIGFYNVTPVARPTISSARDNPEGALADLLQALDSQGIVTDSSTAS